MENNWEITREILQAPLLTTNVTKCHATLKRALMRRISNSSSKGCTWPGSKLLDIQHGAKCRGIGWINQRNYVGIFAWKSLSLGVCPCREKPRGEKKRRRIDGYHFRSRSWCNVILVQILARIPMNHVTGSLLPYHSWNVVGDSSWLTLDTSSFEKTRSPLVLPIAG